MTFDVRFPGAQFGKIISMYQGMPLWEINPEGGRYSASAFSSACKACRVCNRRRASVFPPMTFAPETPFEIVGTACASHGRTERALLSGYSEFLPDHEDSHAARARLYACTTLPARLG